jgi:phosphoribosyl 1,2-cyclic phosphate phosphodiesterase
MHADQTHGINDLRVFYIQNKKTIPIYADTPTKKYLFNTFKYCFINNNKEYPATLKLNSINDNLSISDGKKNLKLKQLKLNTVKLIVFVT